MALQSDDACGEDCELEEYIFDDDELLGNATTSPKAKVRAMTHELYQWKPNRGAV